MQSLEDCVHYSLSKKIWKTFLGCSPSQVKFMILPYPQQIHCSFDCCYTAIVMFPPVSEIISEVDDIACQQVCFNS